MPSIKSTSSDDMAPVNMKPIDYSSWIHRDEFKDLRRIVEELIEMIRSNEHAGKKEKDKLYEDFYNRNFAKHDDKQKTFIKQIFHGVAWGTVSTVAEAAAPMAMFAMGATKTFTGICKAVKIASDCTGRQFDTGIQSKQDDLQHMLTDIDRHEQTLKEGIRKHGDNFSNGENMDSRSFDHWIQVLKEMLTAKQ